RAAPGPGGRRHSAVHRDRAGAGAGRPSTGMGHVRGRTARPRPSQLAIMRRWSPDGRIRSIVDIRWPALRRFLLMFLPTLAAAALAPGLVQWLEPALHRTMQVVLPSWWDLDPGALGARPAWQAAITLTGWLLCFVVIGPITEELYFRGFLLPRLPGRPAVAVPANAILFALYHVWQPYTWATVAIFAVP